ncbi:MAG: cupin domain-containing protein [Defluviitaleaceae bacterium]|nr:cupin domain-containing protein [Defluviitaleaceae bacterium]
MKREGYVTKFDKATAPSGHNGTILAGDVIPAGLTAPFSAAWGYLEGKSMMEAHSHPSEEFYAVFKGSGFCHVNGERFGVAPGDIVEIPPGAPHTMECEEGSLLWAAFWWKRQE